MPIRGFPQPPLNYAILHDDTLSGEFRTILNFDNIFGDLIQGGGGAIPVQAYTLSATITAVEFAGTVTGTNTPAKFSYDNGAPVAVSSAATVTNNIAITHDAVSAGQTLSISYDGTGDYADSGKTVA